MLATPFKNGACFFRVFLSLLNTITFYNDKIFYKKQPKFGAEKNPL